MVDAVGAEKRLSNCHNCHSTTENLRAGQGKNFLRPEKKFQAASGANGRRKQAAKCLKKHKKRG